MKKRILIFLTLTFGFLTGTYAQVNFRADFESGSIGEVKLLKSKKMASGPQDSLLQLRYAITTVPDPDNRANPSLAPSKRWFYFLMTGVKGKEIILEINSNDSKRPVYSYDGKIFTRFSREEVPQENGPITKRYTQDSVYIAYFVPYTYSYLNERIAEWGKRVDTEVRSIGQSEDGRNMPLLVVTNPSVPDKNKKIVYIHGRVHPSESPASWHLDQMIEILTGNSGYARDLRNNAILYILPFANPDGVSAGMSRSNRNGINLEVNWADPEEVTAKEVKNIRAFLQQLTAKGRPVDLFLNMHSQTDPNITYWIHTAESTSLAYYKELMLLANLTLQGNAWFGKGDLSFSKVGSRYLEGWFWDHFGEKTWAATFETPYTYYSKNPEGEWVTLNNLQQSARNNVYALGDYLQLGRNNRVVADNPDKAAGSARQTDLNTLYFGKNYLTTTRAGTKIKYKGKGLPQGTYDVYRWKAGENLPASHPGENEWVRQGTFMQKKNGTFKYIYSSPQAGEKIDAILLIKTHTPLINKDSIHVQ